MGPGAALLLEDEEDDDDDEDDAELDEDFFQPPPPQAACTGTAMTVVITERKASFRKIGFSWRTFIVMQVLYQSWKTAFAREQRRQHTFCLTDF
jgi:hypothetical protein